MTTTVKVEAHVPQSAEVRVVLYVGSAVDVTVLQDGETKEFLIYDDRTVTVQEVMKAR